MAAAGLASAAFAAGNRAGCQQTAPEKPNIIYLLADDLGYGDLGSYGQEKIKTPNLDRMAAEGMRFTQHYAGSSVCAPSRCTLLTGLHTGHGEIRGNKPVMPEGQYPISAGTVTVAELLQQAGYTTGAFGKWGLGAPGTEGVPTRQGFDHFFGYNCQRQAHHYYPAYLWQDGKKLFLEANADGRRGSYSHDLIVEQAMRFIVQNRNSRFFLYLPFTIPHAELLVPEESLQPYRGTFPETPFAGGHYAAQPAPHAAYAAMVSRLDRDVGRIFQLLHRLRLDEKTLVFFASDNGPHHEGGNDPAFFNSSGSLRGLKRDLYEGGIRVPFIARWPGVIAPGTVSTHISAFWDFLPTACELAGVELPPGLDGISFLPALLGKEQPQHEYLYWEFYEQKGKQAVRRGEWKAVRLNVSADRNGPVELYNLRIDPGEQQNVADRHPEIAAQLAVIMQEAHRESPVFHFSQN